MDLVAERERKEFGVAECFGEAELAVGAAAEALQTRRKDEIRATPNGGSFYEGLLNCFRVLYVVNV
jgi:hypothetical protein